MELEPGEASFEEPSEGEDDGADLPWLLVDWEDLYEPEEVVMYPSGKPEEAEHVVVFREEDYSEPDDEDSGAKFAGLVEMEADEEDPLSFDLPESFGCPACPGTAWRMDDLAEDDFFPYLCDNCDISMALEMRTYLRNACVLFVFPDGSTPPVPGDSEKTGEQ
jgi:hypothetical protein